MSDVTVIELIIYVPGKGFGTLMRLTQIPMCYVLCTAYTYHPLHVIWLTGGDECVNILLASNYYKGFFYVT